MERLNLVKFLSLEAADLVRSADFVSDDAARAKLDEAAELLALGAEILGRNPAEQVVLKEAA